MTNIGNIRGPQGIQGATGATGATGPAGSITRGTWANRPGAATAGAGAQYCATDIGVNYLSDGTTWINLSGAVLLNSYTGTAAVSNTTATQTLTTSPSLPDAFFTIGLILRVTMGGIFSGASGVQLTPALQFNATAIIGDVTGSLSAALTNRAWHYEGIVIFTGSLVANSDPSLQHLFTSGTQANVAFNEGTKTLTGAGSNVLKLVFSMSAAAAGNSVTVRSGMLQLLATP